MDQPDVITTPPQTTPTLALRTGIHGDQPPDSGTGIDKLVAAPRGCDNEGGYLEVSTF